MLQHFLNLLIAWKKYINKINKMRNKKSTNMFRIALMVINVVENIFTEHLKITFHMEALKCFPTSQNSHSLLIPTFFLRGGGEEGLNSFFLNTVKKTCNKSLKLF